MISGSPLVLYTACVIKPSALYMTGVYKRNVPPVCVHAALVSQEHFGPQSVCPDSQAPDKKGPEAPWSKNTRRVAVINP